MKFNLRTPKVKATTNYEGAKAYTLTPELELYSAVVTAGLSDNFYEAGNDRLARIQGLLQKNDPEFVAKLALYARSNMHLRSIPLVLAVELAKANSGNPVVGKTVNGVVQRADEISELLAYYQLANQRTGTKRLNKLSKQVQKGLGQAFNRFDAYQFAKYNRDGEVKLRDALFLVHPKAKDEAQQAVFNAIAANTLETPYTWETELSALGQQKFESDAAKQLAFRTKWEELILSGKLGYMAMLRNLRNIIEARVSWPVLEAVCKTLADPKQVAKSKQLPFRFLAAYREVKELKADYVSKVLNALEDAVTASALNLRGFDHTKGVVVACDVSGSMQQPISKNSKVLMYDIGLMLGMLLQSRCQRVVSGIFGDSWKVVNLPNRGVLANVDALYKREGEVGYSTNGYKVIDDLIHRKIVADKVMIFTDCQLWDSTGSGGHLEKSWNAYKQIVPRAKLYLFDLAGHGKTPINILRPDVAFIAGWSDKVFDVLDALESGADTLEAIRRLEL